MKFGQSDEIFGPPSSLAPSSELFGPPANLAPSADSGFDWGTVSNVLTTGLKAYTTIRVAEAQAEAVKAAPQIPMIPGGGFAPDYNATYRYPQPATRVVSRIGADDTWIWLALGGAALIAVLFLFRR